MDSGLELQATVPSSAHRCSVKACVFPASAPKHSLCRYHHHMQDEGELFQSHQPTLALILYAPFGIAEEEPDASRHEDRRLRDAEREAFVLDEPPEWTH